MNRTVLVVEDDPSISMGLEMNLSAEGYQVLVAQDGEAALEAARKPGIDLIILDVMLPKLNGFEVVSALRREQSRVPVIMLSARGGEADKVTGLDLGAEDYITKPFGLAELLARVKVVLRRAAAKHVEPTKFTLGDIEVKPGTREVTRRGAPVELTATEFDVLLCLVEGRGDVRTRDDIKDRVWGKGHHGTPRTIDNFILQLRTKLEADPTQPKHIVTVRGVGYRALG